MFWKSIKPNVLKIDSESIHSARIWVQKQLCLFLEALGALRPWNSPFHHPNFFSWKWVFPKTMVPQIIHFFLGVFHYFHIQFWGPTPCNWKIHFETMMTPLNINYKTNLLSLKKHPNIGNIQIFFGQRNSNPRGAVWPLSLQLNWNSRGPRSWSWAKPPVAWLCNAQEVQRPHIAHW